MKAISLVAVAAAWTIVLAAAGTGAAVSTSERAFAPADTVEEPPTISCSVVDATSGAPLVARCRVIETTGRNAVPVGGGYYHSGNGGYFYATGSFAVQVPRGATIVSVAQGFEYAEYVDTLDVERDTAIVVRLARIVSMSALGWYSGDTHVHINHTAGYYTLTPANALSFARAEGVNVVNCLDNSYYFTGAPASCSLPDRIVYMSEEYRSSSLGHLGLLGMPSLATPVSAGWWPETRDVADSAHARGALVLSAHPISSDDFASVESWPGSGVARELPLDVIDGRIDAVEVMSYSNCHPSGIEIGLWYRLLNCGFRIPASAGTDAGVNRNYDPPLAGFRTYVLVAPAAFTLESWLENLAAGRSFVTNGPLITHFDIDGLSPGDSIAVSTWGTVVTGSISVRSATPVSRIEVIQNGIPVKTIPLSGARRLSVKTTFTLSLFESCWVAVRVSGARSGWATVGDTLFAHTSPIYFSMRGARVAREEDTDYFAAWVDSLRLLAAAKGSWPDSLARARFFSECDAARDFYESLAIEQTTGEEGGGSGFPPSAVRCVSAPNPSSGATAISFTVPGGAANGPAAGDAPSHAGLAVYDVEGRLVRRLVDAQLRGGSYRVLWDGADARGRSLASGIYFARLSVGSLAASHKMIIVR